MRKFICYAMFLYIFLLHLNIFSEEAGYIWMPLSWTLSFNKGVSDESQIKFNSIKLLFRDTNKKNEIITDMKINNKKILKNIVLGKNLKTKTFYTQKLMKFPQGKYVFEGAILERVDNQGNLSSVQIKIINPFNKNTDKHIQFNVELNKISPFPAMAVETNLGVKNGIISQFSHIDLIEDEMISVSEILNQMKNIKKLFLENKIGFNIANEKFPPLQIMGLSVKNSKSNFLGLLIDFPCNIKGNLKYVWVNKNEILQYVFFNKLENKKQGCKIHKYFPEKFYLPNGNWTLQSMSLSIAKNKYRDFYTWSLINKELETKNYFKLNDIFFSYLSIKERALLKNIEIKLSGNKDRFGIYFLGTSEIIKEINTNKKEQINFYFKRNYEIIDLKKQFGSKKIYNAYSGELMKKDRIIGDIQFKIILLGKNNEKNQISFFSDQLKKYATFELAKCVTNQEIIDPLLVLNGHIMIQNYKSNTRKIDVSKKDFKFMNVDGISQIKILDCMEGKLKEFQFSKSFNIPFRAKILFESY
ncbi:hypothetical protein [Silvanigrella aquatica]|uniref:Uncharacterized protein n=1 Tax=Silvanigrella aquatica TaxID=1915309 RepID=A0A1L4CXG1_9BACT|nr:hypothetical protein [Silvanigrella aquatica]APJ02634.1 hypothetical protein AXG55_01280 [Silvanigrella aquatica]